MRRSALFLFLVLCVLAVAARPGRAQSVESAEAPGIHMDAGGIASGFAPGDGNNVLVGAGTYVDVHFSHWFQVEAEGRWLRWNQYRAESEDNYLIGLREPIAHVGRRGQIYGKALAGLGKMDFADGGYGTFTALSFGGTFDYHLSPRVTLRAADFEYQYWPVWLPGQSLEPYGVSAGFAYRIF